MKKIVFILILLTSIIYAEKKKIAVLDLKPVGYFNKEDVQILSNRFRNQIVNTNKFSVMSRSAMVELDKEIAMRTRDGFDKQELAKELAKFGKKKGAAFLVIGYVGKISKRYTIDVMLINCFTTEIEKSYMDDYKGDLDGLIEVMSDIANDMAGIKKKGGLWKWLAGGVLTVGGVAAYLIINGQADDPGLPMPPGPPAGF